MFSHWYIQQYSAYIWLISSIEYEIDCFYYTIFYFAYDIPKEYILTMTHAPQCSFLWFRYLTPWGRRSVLRSSESRGTMGSKIFWRSFFISFFPQGCPSGSKGNFVSVLFWKIYKNVQIFSTIKLWLVYSRGAPSTRGAQ